MVNRIQTCHLSFQSFTYRSSDIPRWPLFLPIDRHFVRMSNFCMYYVYSITSPWGPHIYLPVTSFCSSALFLYISYSGNKNLEVLTFSHSGMPNTRLIQKSSKDLLLSVSLSCSLAPIPNAHGFPCETLALFKSPTYLLAFLIIGVSNTDRHRWTKCNA